MSILKKIKPKRLITAVLVCCTLMSMQTSVAPEYQVKAVFLFNFTEFVEWPSESFAYNQAPFIIGVLGDNPFGSYLEKVVSGEKMKGHPLTVSFFKNPEEIKTCHILFINKNSTNNQKDVLAGLKGKSILTVSDNPDFLKEGGMIRFFTRNNKIQLQINLDAAKNANLDTSSKLLRLAEIYVP